jgi:hypothetical protein
LVTSGNGARFRFQMDTASPKGSEPLPAIELIHHIDQLEGALRKSVVSTVLIGSCGESLSIGHAYFDLDDSIGTFWPESSNQQNDNVESCELGPSFFPEPLKLQNARGFRLSDGSLRRVWGVHRCIEGTEHYHFSTGTREGDLRR